MNFGFSEEQEMIRKSARDFVKGQSSFERLRGLIDDERGYSPQVFKSHLLPITNRRSLDTSSASKRVLSTRNF